MKVVLQVAGATALVAFAYLCLTISMAVRTTSAHLNSLTMQSGDTVRKMNLELDELHRLTLEAGLTAMEARKASAKELAFLDTLNYQVTATTYQAQNTLLAVAHTAEQATNSEAQVSSSVTKTLAALPPVLAASAAEMQQLQLTTQHLDALVADPSIPATLSNVADTSAHVDQMSAEAKTAFHAYLHPTWAQRAWGWSLQIAGHVLNPF